MTKTRVLAVWLALFLGACAAREPATVSGQGAAAPGGAQAAAGVGAFTAELAPIPEIVGTRPHGEARFWLSDDGTSLGYELSVADLGPATSSHLHLLPSAYDWQSVPYHRNPPPPENAHGRAVADLLAFTSGGVRGEGVIAKGEITPADLIGPLKGQPISVLVGLLENNLAYVTVHVVQKKASGQTFCCPDGLRGAVRPAGS